ncbi:MAG: DUF177 domain-containing protein [Candidatus Krumholzibacteriia bacterium]
MKLDLDRQESGRSTLPLEGRLDLDWTDDRPSEVRVTGRLQVDNLENRVLLTGELSACGQATCDRCLEEFALTWPVPVECMVLRNTGSDEGRDDSMVLHQGSGEVDLAEVIRESVILAFPQAAVCSEDCRGLCAQCGANLNEKTCDCDQDGRDPRWDALP